MSLNVFKHFIKTPSFLLHSGQKSLEIITLGMYIFMFRMFYHQIYGIWYFMSQD